MSDWVDDYRQKCEEGADGPWAATRLEKALDVVVAADALVAEIGEVAHSERCSGGRCVCEWGGLIAALAAYRAARHP